MKRDSYVLWHKKKTDNEYLFKRESFHAQPEHMVLHIVWTSKVMKKNIESPDQFILVAEKRFPHTQASRQALCSNTSTSK